MSLRESKSPLDFKSYNTGVTSTLPFLSPTKYIVMWDDFLRYEADNWFPTGAGGGTVTVDSANGGTITITNGAADNDRYFARMGNDDTNVVHEGFTIESGKKLWLEGRFKVSDSTQSDLTFGLVEEDSSPALSDNAFHFTKFDADQTLTLRLSSGGITHSPVDVAEMADDTWIVVGFYFDGADVHTYVNDALVSTVSSPALPVGALSPTFGVQNGEAVAKTMTVDYFLVVRER